MVSLLRDDPTCDQRARTALRDKSKRTEAMAATSPAEIARQKSAEQLFRYIQDTCCDGLCVLGETVALARALGTHGLLMIPILNASQLRCAECSTEKP